ncbi:hypothetical protein [Serpentinicella alkaliphila]|uniref:Uncharacterized protein n=1 Tax=Serpentinicella alkaliphila TaxID=1734049 RepID=A0A4R2TVN0_9FIRM|nr:hypothetical protein [Serpentinicella alkaliphila]QUH26822.1 hypothetical protein HZR23_14555 [Serpentinicella alkaliphila]TCQ08048.1 hypothetical protein EDD79_1001134 [Serpentinicella alkaliphila]
MQRAFGILRYARIAEWETILAIMKSDYAEFYVLEIKSQAKKDGCQKNLCSDKVYENYEKLLMDKEIHCFMHFFAKRSIKRMV